jgi:hypothetical protein
MACLILSAREIEDSIACLSQLRGGLDKGTTGFLTVTKSKQGPSEPSF